MKKRFIFILAISILTIQSCSNQSEDSADSETIARNGLAGGWVEADVLSNELREAVEVAYKSLSTLVEIKQITSAKQQVVKGMNYDVTFELVGGEKWNAIVYRDLSGTYSVSRKPERE